MCYSLKVFVENCSKRIINGNIKGFTLLKGIILHCKVMSACSSWLRVLVWHPTETKSTISMFCKIQLHQFNTSNSKMKNMWNAATLQNTETCALSGSKCEHFCVGWEFNVNFFSVSVKQVVMFSHCLFAKQTISFGELILSKIVEKQRKTRVFSIYFAMCEKQVSC